jgi:hypothetical protein
MVSPDVMATGLGLAPNPVCQLIWHPSQPGSFGPDRRTSRNYLPSVFHGWGQSMFALMRPNPMNWGSLWLDLFLR